MLPARDVCKQGIKVKVPGCSQIEALKSARGRVAKP
jgi:hypothetical protein